MNNKLYAMNPKTNVPYDTAPAIEKHNKVTIFGKMLWAMCDVLVHLYATTDDGH